MTDLQLFDTLPVHIEAALRDSIEEFGVLVPVFVSQDGEIIDGHHRSRIANDLGVDYETTVVQVEDEDHALRIAHTLNADRRQLSTEQRLKAAARLRERGHSYRAIGDALGTSHTQVQRDLAPTGTDVPVEQPERVVGRDGKSRPATRPTPPAEQTEPSPDVEQWVDDSVDVQDAKYLHEFVKALSRSDGLLRFDAERLGPLLSDTEISALDELHRNIGAFGERVRRARRGLRVVNGDKA